MPTYTTSPYVTPLQTTLVTAAAIDHGGKADVLGTTGSCYAIHVDSNGNDCFVLLWDATSLSTGTADVVLKVVGGEDVTFYIDKGITFSTAMTISGSAAADGSTVPSGGTVNVDFFVS